MTRTVEDYAAAVSSGQPIPGGGSVIATVVAFAAGLAEMVCHLTLARPLDPAVTSALSDAQTAAARLRTQFLASAAKDELAYGSYRNAAALPKTTPEEKEMRQHAVQAALDESAAVPLSVAAGCVELLTALETVATFGTRHALADVHTSLRFTEAALKSALDMVSANTTLMRDFDNAARLNEEAEALSTRGQTTATEVARALRTRPS